MLAASARASGVRRVAHRGLATVVDSAGGIKVAAFDQGQPTASVTLLVRAGSRFDTTPGTAHALKNFAFKSTAKRSSLGTVRETELYGGVLSSSLSREHVALTADFMRGDEAFFVDLLTSFASTSKFSRHELEESVLPSCEAETAAASMDPVSMALERAHALAFRTGLGSSLFAPAHAAFAASDVAASAHAAFSDPSRFAFIGTGLDASTLSKLVAAGMEAAGASTGQAASGTAEQTKYHGGQERIEAHSGPQTLFIGFGSSGVPSPALFALRAHLAATPSVKWSQGSSALSPSALPQGTYATPVLLPYSDGSLFGIVVQGADAAKVKEAGKAAVKALKDAGSAKAEDVKKAVAKARFEAAATAESREGFVSMFGTQILAGGDASLESALAPLEKVDASAFSKATSSLLQAKPTYVAVGEINSLPYADELGL